MDYEKLIRKFRKKYLYDFDAESVQVVSYDKDKIKKILPHREPFLLIDSIDMIDIENKAIMGSRTIEPADPILKGHFPDYPLYPGVLHIEMIGQLTLCLLHFVANNTALIDTSSNNINIRLTKIDNVLFQHEVLPGETVKIISKQLDDYDGFLCKGIGQIIKNNQICTIAIVEAYIL